MKRLVRLAGAFIALAAPASALACGWVGPRPYLRATPPDRVEDNQIVAQVELDTSTPLSIREPGLRFRVLWMIRGEPVEALIVRQDFCSSEVPGGHSGYLVATRVERHGDAVVVNPVVPERTLYEPRPMGPQGAGP